jgi:hypothetical protein
LHSKEANKLQDGNPLKRVWTIWTTLLSLLPLPLVLDQETEANRLQDGNQLMRVWTI